MHDATVCVEKFDLAEWHAVVEFVGSEFFASGVKFIDSADVAISIDGFDAPEVSGWVIADAFIDVFAIAFAVNGHFIVCKVDEFGNLV